MGQAERYYAIPSAKI